MFSLQTNLRPPIFIPDRGADEFADSGTRGSVRFVRSGSSIGAYSLKRGARSKVVNRGAIVEVSDSSTAFSACEITQRENSGQSKKDRMYGPELPFTPNPNQSGSISVVATVEKASPSNHRQVSEIMVERSASRRPLKIPVFWTHRDRLTNWLMEDTGPVFYQVSGNTKNEYARLGQIVSGMQMRGGCYFDHAERFIYGSESTKGNAGANKLLDRDVMEVGKMISLHFHLNFHPVTFQFATGRVYFLPDQVVIVNVHGSCQFIGYDEITVTHSEGTQMGVPVPAWSQPVGYSWQFMNRDGGPDRRYNVNPQIPHYKVWEVDLQYPGGRVDTAFSDGDLADQLVDCLNSMKALSINRTAR